MKSKRIITWSIIICTIIYLTPNIIYLTQFKNTYLSIDPSDWGVYGDFIGGSTNPVFTILNIIALVYLTYTVSEIEEKRLKEIAETEEKRLKEQRELDEKRAIESINVQKIITINQMRYNVVVDLTKALDSFTNISTEITAKHSQTFLNITLAVNSFRVNQYPLFKDLFDKQFDEEYVNPLRVSVEKMTDAFQKIRDKVSQFKKTQKRLEFYASELKEKQNQSASEEELQELAEETQKFAEKNDTNIDLDSLLSDDLANIVKAYIEQRARFISAVNKFIIDEMLPAKLA